jgi:hypothetical protein
VGRGRKKKRRRRRDERGRKLFYETDALPTVLTRHLRKLF